VKGNDASALVTSALAALSAFVLLTAVSASAASLADWTRLASNPDEWYRSPEGRRITTNILSWQAAQGDWPKNGDTTTQPFVGDPAMRKGTFDNGATTGELRFLARAYRATQGAPLLAALQNGLDLILKAQYPTGGWPQSYPPDQKYHRHITFNDDAMVRLMRLLRDVATSADFAFVDQGRRAAAQRGFDRGVQCILKCQIIVNGKPTVWCAQHDEEDYSPRPARMYELISLSGGESAGILELLMSLNNPSPEVVRAVEGGVRWYEAAKLTGIRQTKVNGDTKIIRDPTAPPLWARFYEIETNRPIFAGRDGLKKYDIAEIESERRNGYDWYGEWGGRVETLYADWKQKWVSPSGSANPSSGNPTRPSAGLGDTMR
jgi:PelA/Pel-15E family pectate lyase